AIFATSLRIALILSPPILHADTLVSDLSCSISFTQLNRTISARVESRNLKVQERLLAATITAMLLSVPLAEAKDAVPNLGGGLDELAVPSKSLLRAAAPELSATHPVRLDDAGRVLVRISLNGKVPAASVLQSLRATSGVAVAASDLNYRAGVIEAYVPTSGLRDLARKAGVLAVVPSSLMVTNVGVADSQGL